MNPLRGLLSDAAVVRERSARQCLFALLLIAVLLVPGHAQADNSATLVPSEASSVFPQCAVSCSALTQAQSLCVPPTAPSSGRATYVTCFCQSNLLTQLKTSATGTCDDTCTSASDRSLLQSWFSEFCSSGGEVKGTTSNNNDNNNNNQNQNANAAATATATGGADAAATATTQKSTPAPQSWWSGHYQWVIMVIVLIVGFALLTVLGVWLKRRHDAKYPGLYHGATGSANNSGMLFTRQNQLGPGGAPPAPWVAGQDPNEDSVGSSSRTDVVVPKVGPGQSAARLQKNPPPTQGGDDLEIREVSR